MHAHRDVVRELGAVPDVPLRLDVVHVRDGELALAVGAPDAVWDLHAETETLLLADVAALPHERLGGDVDERAFVAVAARVQSKAVRVELEHVHPNRVGERDRVALERQLVDREADLQQWLTVSVDARDRPRRDSSLVRALYTLTRTSELRPGCPYREQRMSRSESVAAVPSLNLRSTVACAAISISAPKVLAGWTRCAMVPIVVEKLYQFRPW